MEAFIIVSCTPDRHHGRMRAAAVAIACVMLVGVAGGCGSGSSEPGASPPTSATAPSAASLAPIHGSYNPPIDPANFVETVDNRYWPLEPGTAFHYEGTRGTTPQTDDEVITHRTVRILGIRCTVVRDTVSEKGRAVERTFDYYAQDKQGNVWYLGEDSFEREHGRFVKASDSWRSGVDGAEPGIIMPADPRPGESYRQEYYPAGERSTRRASSACAARSRCRTAASSTRRSRASSARSSRRPRRSTTSRESAISSSASSRVTTRSSVSCASRADLAPE
jgi:hypothetical protein